MILVTGAAGFIGYHMTKRLLESGFSVVGIDNINDYYDVSLKKLRLSQLDKYDDFIFHKISVDDRERLYQYLSRYTFDYVIHLAAQAGVRYSIENPEAYLNSNILGFLNILEYFKDKSINHLIYASSSSVYGGNKKVPFSEDDSVDSPVSFYAATKKSNELMAHVYSKLYKLPTTGLRFFTVYGPYGRPDMAYFKFANKMIKGNKIEVYGYGKLSRDFTYIDDIIEGIFRLLKKPSQNEIPYHLFNIGNGNPIGLLDFIEILERTLGLDAKKEYVEMQPGDVETTYADVQKLYDYVGYKPCISFEEGILKFVEWFKEYNGGIL